MKIKFESDDDLPLGKTFNVLDMIIVPASVLEKMVNITHKVFYMKAHISYKNSVIQGKLMFQKELTLMKQVYQRNVCFVIIWYFRDLGFKFKPHICNKRHLVLMAAYELKSIAILNVKRVDFRCILWGISRDEPVNWLNNSVLEDNAVV